MTEQPADYAPDQSTAPGLRLGTVQEERLRRWPKERIRPKSIAIGVISLLAEVDALRDEMEQIRDVVGAQSDETTLRAVQDMMTERQHYVRETNRASTERDAARADLKTAEQERDGLRHQLDWERHKRQQVEADRDVVLAAAGAFVEHHDAGQAGQPGHPKTYGEHDIWLAEWDRLLAVMRALVGEAGR